MEMTATQPTRRKSAATGGPHPQPKDNVAQRQRPRRQGGQPGQPGRDRASAADQAQSVTAALLRTKDLMAQELDRVSTLNTSIADDGALLQGAREEHAGMGGTMRGARKVMARLGRQDVRDAIVLRCAVGFYWAAVAYVLWTRIKVPFLP